MAAPGTAEANRDWFVAAIEAEGSVDDSLAAVLRELDQRSGFVRGLQERMAPRRRGGPDAVSDLSVRVRALENTLRFRLGILRAERPAAWFRAPAATTNGPFSSTLLDEAILGPYELADVAHVRGELATLWQERRADRLPFRDQSPCLWRTLLGLNAELAELSRLPAPFEQLTLTTLPEGLPPSLESRALRAFLLNVQNEILQAQARLSACYRELLKKCEELWVVQEASAPVGKARGQERVQDRMQEREPGDAGSDDQRSAHSPADRPHATGAQSNRTRPGGAHDHWTRTQADSVREELRRRRETRLRFALTTADQRALACMGFNELPSADALRRRYIELAKRLHPDRAGGEDGPFKELASAYSRLLNRLDAVTP